MKIETYNDQRNQLWIYLAICWWIGSLFAWLSCWIGGSLNPMDDSSLTFSALLVATASLALRLPVLTPQQETSSMEDHFVWILCITANVNWFGYLWLKSGVLSAILPAIAIGLIAEVWLWSQAAKNDCVGSFRCKTRQVALKAAGYLSIGFSPLDNVRLHENKLARENQLAHENPLADEKRFANENYFADQGLKPAQLSTDQPSLEVATEGNQVRSTMEDGVDPTGRRYLAGEIVIQWQPDQRTQQLVVGFVPAFTGVPEVDYELDSLDCSAQVLNCTPVGLRFSVRRSRTDGPSEGVLSWYARQSEARQEAGPKSPNSQPGTLA